MAKHPNTDLPPNVAAHVRRQLIGRDWESLLSDLRGLCADCPADRDPDICINCPLEGIAVDAATLTLKARLEKMKKSQNHKKAVRDEIGTINGTLTTDGGEES